MAIALVTTWASLQSVADEKPDTVLIERIASAANRSELAEATEMLLQKASRESLEQYKRQSNTTIALQAAWEHVLRGVPREPAADEDGPPRVRLDRRRLNRFLGFVEGRLQIDIPQWWMELLQAGRASGRHVTFPKLLRKSPYSRIVNARANAGVGMLEGRFRSPDDVFLEEKDSRFLWRQLRRQETNPETL